MAMMDKFYASQMFSSLPCILKKVTNYYFLSETQKITKIEINFLSSFLPWYDVLFMGKNCPRFEELCLLASLTSISIIARLAKAGLHF